MISLPPFIPPAAFHNAADALAEVQRIYDAACAHLLVPDGTITQVTDYILQTVKELL